MKNSEQCAFANPGSDQGPGSSGLTKREYFASKAMQGLLSNSNYIKSLEDNMRNNNSFDMNRMLVAESLNMADELLKQLEK